MYVEKYQSMFETAQKIADRLVGASLEQFLFAVAHARAAALEANRAREVDRNTAEKMVARVEKLMQEYLRSVYDFQPIDTFWLHIEM